MKPFIFGDSFSDWLQNELALRNMSQAELSRISGLTRECVCRVFHGDAQPRLDTLSRICSALTEEDQLCFIAAAPRKMVKK